MVRERVWTAGSPMFSVLVKQESEEETHVTHIYEFTNVKPMIAADIVYKYVEYVICIYDKKNIKYRYATNFTGNTLTKIESD